MTTKTKNTGAAPAATAIPGAYSVDDLAAAFTRAGLDIQWVGRDQGKPMTVGSIELTELLKVVVELPPRGSAGAGISVQSVGADGEPVTVSARALDEHQARESCAGRGRTLLSSEVGSSVLAKGSQSAPAELFADAVARLAAHDHAAATDLADKYRASLSQPMPATGAAAASQPEDECDVASEVKAMLHEVARRGNVDPDYVTSIIALFPRPAQSTVDPSELISVEGFDYPTTYGELANLPAEKLWNRYKMGRALDPRTAFLVARAIPFVRSVVVPATANDHTVAQATLDRAYEILGIGTLARKSSILLTNIENAARRSACLSRIESILTTVRIEDGEEVEECPMNWGANPEEYAEQFRAALDQRGSGVQVVPVTGYGQVEKGDVLLVKRGNEFVAPVEVKDVLQAGTEQEEIILSAAKNVYFIVRKFLAGESWIKECSKLVNGRIYSITNNQRDILCNSRDDRAVRAPRATAADEDQA